MIPIFVGTIQRAVEYYFYFVFEDYYLFYEEVDCQSDFLLERQSVISSYFVFGKLYLFSAFLYRYPFFASMQLGFEFVQPFIGRFGYYSALYGGYYIVERCLRFLSLLDKQAQRRYL